MYNAYMKSWHDRSLWEQPFVDLWAIPHTLFGVLVASVVAFLGWSMSWGVVATIALAILWEFLEELGGTTEYFSNRISDVIVATLGYFIAWAIIAHWGLDHATTTRLLIAVVILVIVSNSIGWAAYFHYSK